MSRHSPFHITLSRDERLTSRRASRWQKNRLRHRLKTSRPTDKDAAMSSSHARVAPGLLPPEVVVQVKALACELPTTFGVPLSRLSSAEVVREVQRAGIVAAISDKTVWRWLHEDAIRPWQLRTLIFPRDPHFRRQGGPHSRFLRPTVARPGAHRRRRRDQYRREDEHSGPHSSTSVPPAGAGPSDVGRTGIPTGRRLGQGNRI